MTTFEYTLIIICIALVGVSLYYYFKVSDYKIDLKTYKDLLHEDEQAFLKLNQKLQDRCRELENTEARARSHWRELGLANESIKRRINANYKLRQTCKNLLSLVKQHEEQWQVLMDSGIIDKRILNGQNKRDENGRFIPAVKQIAHFETCKDYCANPVDCYCKPEENICYKYAGLTFCGNILNCTCKNEPDERPEETKS